MPLYFPTAKGNGPMERVGDRSNTGLIAGNHDTPNTQFIVDPTLPLLFHYEYGGPGQQEIVISKGMAIALTGQKTRHHETGRTLPVLTIADSSNSYHRPIGLSPYNYSMLVDDRLTGNKPVVINDKYVELPYIPDEFDAELVKWGAVTGEGIVPGDWVKPGSGANKGKLVKWEPYRTITEVVPDFESDGNGEFIAYTKYPIKPDTQIIVSEGEASFMGSSQVKITELDESQSYSGMTIQYTTLISDPPHLAIAQVWEAELDQEPWGWLKWAMWDEAALMEDLGADRDVPEEDGYPFDPAYKDPYNPTNNRAGYLSDATTDPTGVPGLLDGENREQKQWTDAFTIPQGTTEGTIVQKQLSYRNLVSESLSVHVDVGSGYVAYGGDVTVNMKKGIVNIEVDSALESAAASSNVAGEIRYRAHFFGTPTGWDLKGSVGALRLLLQR